jgi:hypothetical protein
MAIDIKIVLNSNIPVIKATSNNVSTVGSIQSSPSVISFVSVGEKGVKGSTGDTGTISSEQQSAINANTAKVGITTAQSEKLSGIQANAELNVQSDFNVTDPNEDAFIKNKPTTITTSQANAIIANTAKTNTTYSVSCVDGDNSDEEKIRLTGSDSSTDDVVLEAGTGLSIARSGDKITFTNTVTDTDTVLTSEQVQDIVGAMVDGGTETNISVTYDDTSGKLNFVSTDTNTQNTTTLSFVDSSNDIILRNTTGGAGSGTDDIKFVAGSNITLTHTDADNITIASTDTNTQLTQEQVEDFAGALVATGGTKTNIAVTYDDANGNMDFVVASDLNTTGTAGGLSSTLVVGSGGTGATTLTSDGVLTGNGTSAIQSEANVKVTSNILTITAEESDVGGFIKIHEAADNGSNVINLQAPDSLGANKNVTLPSSSGTLALQNENTTGTASTVTSGTQASITTCANLTTVGTIGTGVWQGTAIASAYLDSDTAHLSSAQTFTGAKQINIRKFPVTGTTDAEAVGDVIYIGTGSTVAGKIYYYASGGGWTLTQANAAGTATGMLAVALGTDPDTDGMLLRGTVTLSQEIGGTEALGSILYLDDGTTGAATVTAPDSNNDIVRIIGYSLSTDNDMIWFNPDSAWVEINA